MCGSIDTVTGLILRVDVSSDYTWEHGMNTNRLQLTTTRGSSRIKHSSWPQSSIRIQLLSRVCTQDEGVCITILIIFQVIRNLILVVLIWL